MTEVLNEPERDCRKKLFLFMIANTVIAYHFTFGPVRPALTEVHFIALLPGDAENTNYATVALYITSTNAECDFKI